MDLGEDNNIALSVLYSSKAARRSRRALKTKVDTFECAY
jgi:hypothetical protein